MAKKPLHFDEVVNRLKSLLNVNADKDLAKELSMSPNAFHNRKKSSSLPYPQIIDIANEQKVNLNWLINGQGPIYKDTNLEPSHGSEKSENAAQSVATHHHQKNDIASSQPPVTELITKTIEILESETVFSNALSANIQAFHEATRAEQKLTELQANTEKRFKEMDRRMAALETENNKLKEQIKNTPGGSSRLAANEG